LTRKQWHDDPIPDELPQNEIPENGGVPSMNEISSFFNEDRRNKLKLLIEAIINSSNENTVHFSDDHKNLKYWFKTLSVCLPKTIQNTVSFCTHFTNTLIPGNISSRIQIRVNRPDSSQFSYTQEAQRGHYAFDFLRNITSESVKPGKYTENIVNLLSLSIFEAVKFVDNINKVMSVYSVNINEASDLMNINKADYSKFANTDEICNTILIADRVGYETQSIANNLWTKEPQFNFNAEQKLSIYAFVYENNPSRRIEIIRKVIDGAEQLGIRTDGASIFRNDIHSKAKFIFSNYLDYLDYLKTEGLANYITKNQNSFIKLYLAYDFLTGLSAVKTSVQNRNYNATEEVIAVKRIFDSAFKRLLISDIDLLMDSANSHINGLGVEILSVIVKDAINSGSQIKNVKFAFEILTHLYPKTDFAYAYLLFLIKNNLDQDEFIKTYINAQNNEPDFYARFENEKKGEALLVEFCKKKDAFRFANSNTLTLNHFKEYFDKYYVTGADTGLFVKRLGEYLYAFQSGKKISECINIIDTLKLSTNEDKIIMPPIYRIVLETIFSLSYEEIYEKCGKKEFLAKINEIYSTIESAGVSLKQETRELVVVTLCRQILEKYGSQGNKQAFLFFSKEQADADSLAVNLEKISSAKSINIFVDYYFHFAANILIAGASAKQFDYYGVLEKVFGRVIEKGDFEKITDNIISAIKKSKTNPVVFILYIFRKHLARSQKILDKKIGDIARNYFEILSSGERKKTFSELLSLAEPTEVTQFERYFEEFNKEHKGGLFGFFRK